MYQTIKQVPLKYLKNTSWLFWERVLRLLMGLFVGAWVARYLGPEQFGLLSYVQSFVGLFIVLSTLGLDNIVVREIVKNTNIAASLIGTAFILKLLGAIFMLLIITLTMTTLFEHDSSEKVLIFIVAFSTIFHSFNVIDYYFQSQVLSRYVVYANVLVLFVSSLTKIALIINEADLMAFVWVVLFDSVVLALSYTWFFLKKTDYKIADLALTFRKDVALSLLRDSWPLILSGLVISVYMKIDQVMIREMLDNEAVGQYAAAVKISTAWYFIPVVVASSFFPAIINARKISKDLYYERLQKLYDLNFTVALVLGLPVVFFSSSIIEILYGQDFTQSAAILSVHIFCGFLVFMGVVRGKWILSENLQRYDLYIHVIAAVANIVFNFAFISWFGVIGAAYGTLLSYLFALFFSPLIIKEIRPSFSMILNGYKNVLTLKILKKEYFNGYICTVRMWKNLKKTQ